MRKSNDPWDALGEVIGLFGDARTTSDDHLVRLVDASLAVTGGHRGILTFDSREKGLDLRIARNAAGEDLDPESIRFSRTVLSEVLSTGEAVFAPDVAAITRFADADTIRDLSLGSLFCVPLVGHRPEPGPTESRIAEIAQRVLGALYVDSTVAGDLRFDPRDTLRVLENLARLATVALHNHRLFLEATTDRETGLATRNHFLAQLATECEYSARREKPVSVLLLRPRSSEAVVPFGRFLADRLRPGDLAARYGHDLFAALLPGTDRSEAESVLNYVRHYQADHPFDAGAACVSRPSAGGRELLEEAEEDLARVLESDAPADPAAGILTGDPAEDHRRLQSLLDLVASVERSRDPADAERRILEAVRDATGIEGARLLPPEEAAAEKEIGATLPGPESSLGTLVVAATPETIDPTFLRALARAAGPALAHAQRSAFQRSHLEEENLRLREALERRQLVMGTSGAMKSLLSLVEKAARTPTTVLLYGETGTGKEGIARIVHDLSEVRDGPFVPVDCTSIPEALVESEFFGHVKGAFTGAEEDRVGCLLSANGGTLFLDEVGELPLGVQAKLLRSLQEREVRPLGQERTVPLEIRLVAATNRDLEQEVAEGNFREDLFYRLRVIALTVPPLRQRRADIVPLARTLLERTVDRSGKPSSLRLSSEAEKAVVDHDWPGNVRELEHRIERAVVVATDSRIELADLGLTRPGRIVPLKETMLVHEADYLQEVLAILGGNATQAASALGISRATFYTRLKKCGIAPSTSGSDS